MALAEPINTFTSGGATEGEAETLGETETLGLIETEGDRDGLAETDGEIDGLKDTEGEIDGLAETDGEILGLIDADGEIEGEILALGDTETLGLMETEGEIDGLAETEGEIDGLTDTDGEIDGLSLALGETDTDGEIEGETETDGDREAIAGSMTMTAPAKAVWPTTVLPFPQFTAVEAAVAMAISAIADSKLPAADVLSSVARTISLPRTASTVLFAKAAVTSHELSVLVVTAIAMGVVEPDALFVDAVAVGPCCLVPLNP